MKFYSLIYNLKPLIFWAFINRDDDEGNKIGNMKPLGRQYNFLRYKIRKVNFVIFVVDGVVVLDLMDDNNKGYTEILRQTFMYLFLSIGGRDC